MNVKINEIKSMDSSEIKMLLTAINRQIKYADSYLKSVLKIYIKTILMHVSMNCNIEEFLIVANYAFRV